MIDQKVWLFDAIELKPRFSLRGRRSKGREKGKDELVKSEKIAGGSRTFSLQCSFWLSSLPFYGLPRRLTPF